MLFEHMGANDLAEVQVISPARWGRERGHTVHAPNYHHECLEAIGQSITSFRLRGLEDYLIEFNPNVLYVMEEPYTPFALHCSIIAQKLKIPTAVFTWENVLDKSFGERFDKIEAEVIDKATILIAGTKGAKARLVHKGAAEDKITICPQTGINTQLFADMHLVKRSYDLAYVGRMIKEKGVDYIENTAKNLNLKMLWVGGRGGLKPSYGDYVPWVDYLKMPEYYNKTKLFVTYPNSFNGFYEQTNYSIPEAMACGTPVVTSTNGSIYEVYYDAPIDFVVEANEDELEEAIANAIDNPAQEIVDRGIEWVQENLSVPAIAQRLVKILKGV
jgi:glycosyltransferase involved in cell wall biosynthesis